MADGGRRISIPDVLLAVPASTLIEKASTEQEKVQLDASAGVNGLQHLHPPTTASSSSLFSPLSNAYDRFSRWRSSLGLSYPGNVESLQKEVKGIFFTTSPHTFPSI